MLLLNENIYKSISILLIMAEITLTPFQEKFKINDDFYTAETIRKAILECFPYTDGAYAGLSRLAINGAPFHANSKLDLESLIPDNGIRSIGIIEGIPKVPEPTASTFFIWTDLGYICDEMKLSNHHGFPIKLEKIITPYRKK